MQRGGVGVSYQVYFFKDVICECDEFRVDTHLCKLRATCQNLI